MSPRMKPLALFLLPALMLLVGMACNLPLTGGSTTSQTDLIQTAAAETLQAQLTEISQPTSTGPVIFPSPTPGGQASPTPTGAATALVPTAAPPTLTSSPTPTSAPVQLPSATPTPVCNQATFIKDVSVPDNTEFPPGKTFVKTWRFQNSGTCAWNAGYSVVVDGQNPLGAPPSSPFPNKTVAPGQTVDLSVNMTAPAVVGTYRTNFKLRSDGGEKFGVGNQNKPFWAQIEVVVASGLTFDFNTNGAAAVWTSGTGSTKEYDLKFGGDPADAYGAAAVVEGVKLENGTTSGKLLLTVPNHTDNGYTRGDYPAYLVQPGDHLKGRLGFMLPSGSNTCGSGKMKFEIRYFLGDALKKLGDWTIKCDGSLTPIDLDLTSLGGKSVRFVLIVHSVGAFLDNYGAWNSLGVFH
jgi:hypothetical protein